MRCKACGGQLVMRETFEYHIDEDGVYFVDNDTIAECVVCIECGGRHAYDELTKGGGFHTIALEVNSDPEPVATVTIAFTGGVVDAIGADRLVGLLVIDEDRAEIGRFMALPNKDEWGERVKRLEALIPKGESRASFATGEEEKVEI